VIGPQLGGVGQPQVAAENVDTLLTAKSGGFVGDTGHRIHAGDTHGDIVVAELSRRSAAAAPNRSTNRPCSVSRCRHGLHRTELDRYTAEESAREADRRPDF